MGVDHTICNNYVTGYLHSNLVESIHIGTPVL